MISPLKDILIGTSLGLVLATGWNRFKENEMSRINNFYKWYDAQQANKPVASAHDDDDEDDE